MSVSAKYPVVDILGIPVSAIRMSDVLDIANEHIANREGLLIGVVNVAKIVNISKDASLRSSFTEAKIIIADGAPIVWLSRILRTTLPERITGIDLMYGLLKTANEKGYRVYFLGAKQNVLLKVIDVVSERYPRVIIAGYRDGYFSEHEEQSVAQDIRNSQSDIIFVGITSPKKEDFLRKWKDFVNVPVCHGVGGSFDVMAGVTKRAPKWMQNCGLEWFYRLIQEPRRMWKRYLVTNTVFIGLGISEIIRVTLNRLRGISNVETSCSVKADDE
ncbi:MAG: WecB/TagA/CpsF family glycosyltransferase [Planctomycetota bacterium]